MLPKRSFNVVFRPRKRHFSYLKAVRVLCSFQGHMTSWSVSVMYIHESKQIGFLFDDLQIEIVAHNNVTYIMEVFARKSAIHQSFLNGIYFKMQDPINFLSFLSIFRQTTTPLYSFILAPYAQCQGIGYIDWYEPYIYNHNIFVDDVAVVVIVPHSCLLTFFWANRRENH